MFLSFKMLSRQKPAIGPGSTTPAKENKKKKKLPKVEEFLENRDYTGAITLLEVNVEYFYMISNPVMCNLLSYLLKNKE